MTTEQALTGNPGEPIVFNNYGELVCGRLVRVTPKTATIRVPAYGGGWYERKAKRSWVHPAPAEWVARLEAMEQATAPHAQRQGADSGARGAALEAVAQAAVAWWETESDQARRSPEWYALQSALVVLAIADAGGSISLAMRDAMAGVGQAFRDGYTATAPAQPDAAAGAGAGTEGE